MLSTAGAGLEGYDRVVVGAVIADEEDRILLLRRAAHEYMGGAWEIPSGGVESGEDIAAALRREIAEETGLEVVELLGAVSRADYDGSEGRCVQLNFKVRCRGTVALSEEHEDHMWWRPSLGDDRIDDFMREVLSPLLPAA